MSKFCNRGSQPGIHVPLAWASAGGRQNGHLPPLEIGTKKQKFLENAKSAV